MAEILPALMPKNFLELEQYAKQFKGLVNTVQVDVMDGVFVPEASWPYNDGDVSFKEIVSLSLDLPESGSIDYEFDLMISAPEESIKSWMQTRASRFIFHVESIKDQIWFWKHLSRIKDLTPAPDAKTVEIGLALNTTTSNEEVYPYVDKIDFVQCMGIEKIGFQGQRFDERVLDKIEDLRKRFPKLIISVDGGVSLETAPKLIAAGADRLVSGSAILESGDIKNAIKEFQSLGK